MLLSGRLVASGLMSFGGRDEIVVRKKRRRRVPVDPCLSYYSQDAEATQINEVNRAGGELEDVERAARETRKEEPSSDSVQAITSPYSENDPMVTVDAFLQQQAASAVHRRLKTYSSKRQKRILFSSDEEDQMGDSDRPAWNSNNPSPGPRKPSSRKASRSRDRKSHLLAKSHVKRKGIAFSKRLQRAAALSCVEQDANELSVNPLCLVPLGDRSSPRTPLRDKRIKLVDPRIPRPLDTIFASKENMPHQAKSCQPFLRWGTPTLRMTAGSLSVPSTSSTVKKSARRTSGTMLAPLKLIPYDEHDQARRSKFDQKFKDRRAMTALYFQRKNGGPPHSVSEVEEDPFEPLPLTCEAEPVLVSQAEHQQLQSSREMHSPSFSLLSGGTQVIPDSALKISQPQSLLPDVISNNALQSLQIAYGSESPTNTSADLQGCPSSPLHVAGSSQRPMRGISSLLGSLRETARSVLLSQSQSQPRSHLRENGSDEETRNRRTRSSRRVIVSSPARCPASSSRTRPARTATMTYQAQMRTKSIQKIRKSASMPSVSAFLEQDIEDQCKNVHFPSITGAPPSRHLSSLLSPLLDSSGSHAHNLFAPDPRNGESEGPVLPVDRNNSFFFNGNRDSVAPNLFNLLEDAVPCNDAQILLSPAA